MKSFFPLLILFLFSFTLYSSSFDSEIKKARDMESQGVVVCNPIGKNDGIAPIIAFKQLKPGMTLELTRRPDNPPPKKSHPPLIVPNDKIIITTREGERLNYNVIVQGKDCVVRNGYFSSINMNNDGTIVDSFSYSIYAGNKDGRANVNVYNTILHSFRNGPGKVDVEFKNCTFLRSVACKTNLKLTISESVLFSEQIVFYFYDYHNKKGRLLLKNNIIHGNNGYAKMEESPSAKKMGMICLEPKDLKKLWSVTFQGENIYDEPKFEGRYSVLTEDSPGQGKGIIPDEYPLIQFDKKREADKAKERDEKRGASVEQSKKERDDRKRPNTRKPAKDKVKTDGDFGDLPKPPE